MQKIICCDNYIEELTKNEQLKQSSFVYFTTGVVSGFISIYLADKIIKIKEQVDVNKLLDDNPEFYLYLSGAISGGVGGMLLPYVNPNLTPAMFTIISIVTLETVKYFFCQELLDPHELLRLVINDSILVTLIVKFLNIFFDNDDDDNEQITFTNQIGQILLFNFVLNTVIIFSKSFLDNIFNIENDNLINSVVQLVDN